MGTNMHSRRSVLRAGAGTAVGGAALANARSARAQAAFDGWLEDVSNYDGVVDETGSEEVPVGVGVEANNGNFGFGPAAVQVDPGTTVVWEWTGEGGAHNVVDNDGDFASELSSEAGFTYTQSFDSEGVVKYFCEPHRGLGMKGVVVVGALPEGVSTAAADQAATEESQGGGGQNWMLIAVVVSIVAGLLSPLAFAAFLNRNGD